MSNRPSVAAVIRSNIAAVMEAWEKAVRQEVPASKNCDRDELFNGLPRFLEHIALRISTARQLQAHNTDTEDQRRDARAHGIQRARLPGYTLDQVIQEHQLLRRILFQCIQEKTTLDYPDLETLLESVDIGISEAATAFALERGFRDARYQEMEAEKNRASAERNEARDEVGALQIERNIREKFVSTLSHDLRTPISSARLAAQMITKAPENRDQVISLGYRITDDLSRADRMIRDLLDANRIRAGEKLPLEINECRLVELITRTIEQLSKMYGNRFVIEAGREITGWWSASDLQRSIENLAINAVKYGSPDVPIEVRVHDHGSTVSIEVHNTGSLITPEEQKALFQPFSRRHSESGKRGWGLGLTLVLGITEAHGGQVRVSSSEEGGTTFTMVIPKDSRNVEGKAA